MVLHLLFGQQQLRECVELVDADDTLLVMETAIAETLGQSLSSLPCNVIVLEDSDLDCVRTDGLSVTDPIGWLELVKRHPHSMSWS